MLELHPFITKVIRIKAIQLTEENLEAAGELSGAWYDHDEKGMPFILLDLPSGQVKGVAGMWLISKSGKRLLMRDETFTYRYEESTAPTKPRTRSKYPRSVQRKARKLSEEKGIKYVQALREVLNEKENQND